VVVTAEPSALLNNPEPGPGTERRFGCGPFSGLRSGIPKRRKKRSMGEFCGNGRLSSRRFDAVLASTLTRTEITAGLTFSTRSPKPTGRWALSAAAAVGNAGIRDWGETRTTAAAMPRLATVASRMRRRVERARSKVTMMMNSIHWGLRRRRRRWLATWKRLHYRVMSVELIFSNQIP